MLPAPVAVLRVRTVHARAKTSDLASANVPLIDTLTQYDPFVFHRRNIGRVLRASATRRKAMNLQKTYPSLLTADLAAAEGWYTKLLGRGGRITGQWPRCCTGSCPMKAG